MTNLPSTQSQDLVEKPITKETPFMLRLGTLVVVILFICALIGSIIVGTFKAAEFMRNSVDSQTIIKATQESIKEIVVSNRNDFKIIRDEIDFLRKRQEVVMAEQKAIKSDNWTIPLQQLWAYEFEQKNREVVRAGGGSGLSVPIPKQQTPQ